MQKDFDEVLAFTKDNYGVMIGEYGVVSNQKDGIPAFYKEVMSYSKKIGFLPIMWDTGLYDREAAQFRFMDMAQVFVDFTGAKGVVPKDGEVTGIQLIPLEKEENLKLLYTWDGTWIRTNGAQDFKPVFKTTSVDEGMTVTPNAYGWQLFFTVADWSKMSNPCIKVTMDSGSLSQKADLVLAYTDKADGNWNGTASYQERWIEKCIKLDPDMLSKHKWIMISSNTQKSIIKKIQIYDAK